MVVPTLAVTGLLIGSDISRSIELRIKLVGGAVATCDGLPVGSEP
jgi:hypothetical protein